MASQRTIVALGAVAALLGVAGAGWWFLQARPPEPPRTGPVEIEQGTARPEIRPGNGVATAVAPADDGDDEDPMIDLREPSGEMGGATAEEILAAIAAGKWMDVERLLSIAGSDDPRVTEALAKALSDLKWRYKVAELVKHLKDPGALNKFLEIAKTEGDDQTRSAALLACAYLGGPGVVEAASDILRNAKPGGILAEGAARALGTLGSPEAARTLVDMLRGNLGTFRSMVFVEALGKIQGPEALELLGKMALDQGNDAALRESLLMALGRSRNAAVVPDLLKAAKDGETPEIRRAALGALGVVGAVEGVVELLNVVQNGSNDDKLIAATALAGVRNKAAAPLLDQALQGNLPGELRGHVVGALGKCGSAESVGTLGKIATDSSETTGMKTTAVRALGDIGAPAGAAFIFETFDRSDRSEAALRRECIGALQETATSADLPRVEKLLKAAPEKTAEWYGLSNLAEALRSNRRDSDQGSVRIQALPAGAPVPGGRPRTQEKGE